MKKENFEAIERVANEFGIKVTLYPQEYGFNHIECEYWTDTLMSTDNVFNIVVHDGDCELSEFCDELNEFWKEYDPEEETLLFFQNHDRTKFGNFHIRQVLEEYELVDEVIEKFVNACYEERNRLQN